MKCYIWIEINKSGYTISNILRQLNSETSLKKVVIKIDLGQWHLIAFFVKNYF